jgi:hypothetical protein
MSWAPKCTVRHPKLVRRAAAYASPLTKFDNACQLEFLQQAIALTPDADAVKWEREYYENGQSDSVIAVCCSILPSELNDLCEAL